MAYQQLEYIESTGSQYIDTGYTPAGDTSVKMSAAFPDLSANSTVFCARADKGNQATYSCILVLNVALSGFRYDYNNTNTEFTEIIPAVDKVVEVYAHKNKMFIDGVLGAEHGEAAFTAGGRLWLFKAYYIKDSEYTAVSNPVDKMKLYSCRIYDGDTLVRDYVPMRDTDTGNVGLYDKVNGIFYASQTENFLAGPLADLCLIRSGSTLYTVADGALSALTETEVTAEVFQTYGVDYVPDGALLVSLTDPEVLYWQDSADELPDITITVKGTPPLPQMVTSEPMDLTHESIAGISHAAVDASADVRFAISFDDGASWKAFDGSAWFDVSDTAPGMLASTMNAITAEQWAEVVQLTDYRLRFWLPNVTAYVKSVVMHYINP